MKRIRVATGDELRMMCAPYPCSCPGANDITLIGAILSALGLAFKILIVGGLIYVTYDAGLWGNSEQTEELYVRSCRVFAKQKKPTDETEKTQVCEEEEELYCMVKLNHTFFINSSSTCHSCLLRRLYKEVVCL